MQNYLRCLSAEVLKYRRTMALWLAIGIPALLAAISWLILTQTELANRPAEARWQVMKGFTSQTWATSCLHIGGAILIGMLWGLEHSSNQLKHVLAQPPSRHAMFWAKTTGILGLIGLGTLVLCALSSAVALACGMGDLRWDITLHAPFRAYVAALPTMALVSWVAQRYSSFALPLILGVVGLIVGGIASSSEDYWPFVPWAWSLQAALGDAEVQGRALVLSVCGGSVALVGSWLHFLRADTPS